MSEQNSEVVNKRQQIQLKRERLEYLVSVYSILDKLQKGAVTKDQIIDAIQRDVEEYLPKIKTVKLTDLKGGK